MFLLWNRIRKTIVNCLCKVLYYRANVTSKGGSSEAERNCIGVSKGTSKSRFFNDKSYEVSGFTDSEK